MKLTLEESELNFVNFAASFVDPAERDLETFVNMDRQPLALGCARGTLIEVAGWLHLGAAVGYFPAKSATTATSAIMRHRAVNVAEFLRSWGYTLDPFARSQCEAWLALPNSISPPNFQFESIDATRELFRTVIRQAGRFTRDTMAQSLTVFLDFYNRKDFLENLTSRSISFEEIERAVDAGIAFDPANGEVLIPAAFVGLGRWLEYLVWFKKVLTTPHESGYISATDSQALLRQVSRLQTWRFYGLADGSLAARDVRAVLVKLVAQAYRLPEDEATDMANMTDDLINTWVRSTLQVDSARR